MDHDGAAYRASLTDQALNAYAARGGKPFDEWVKDKKCHGCGEMGHIEKDCPKRSRGAKSSSYRSYRRDRDRDNGDASQRDQQSQRGRRPQRRQERERRVRKIFKAVMDQLVEQSSSESEEDGNASPRAHNTTVEDGNDSGGNGSDSDSDASLAAHAARMFASLKE